MINFFQELRSKIPAGRLSAPPIVWPVSVLVIAAVLRCVAWSNTALITPDGASYIFQAKAVFYGQWDAIADCIGFRFFSIYPFLIAAVYHFFPDWVIAARAINFSFGVAIIIPLYLLLRQFFDHRISALAALIVAVSPLFVGASVDVLRDPIAWFFSALGLYLFTSGLKEDNNLFLLLSSVFFLLATWTKTEPVILFAISFGYLVWKERSIKKTLIFISPAMVIVALGLLMAFLKGSSINDLHKFDIMASRLLNSFSSYAELNNELAALEKGVNGQAQMMLKLFLPEARMNIWLVAAGMLLNRVLEAFMYVFAIPLLIGFGKMGRIKEDPRLSYFLLLAAFALFAMYLFIIQTWMLQYRYVVMFILPSIIFSGFGLESIIKWISMKYRLKESFVIIILACVMVFCTLPKNMKDRDFDKIVFKEIGEFMVQREGGNQREIKVSAPLEIYRWASFYANLNYQGATCFDGTKQTSWELFSKQRDLIEQLKQREIKYFLWTERTWNGRNADIKEHLHSLKELSRWTHPDTGKIILYEVI